MPNWLMVSAAHRRRKSGLRTTLRGPPRPASAGGGVGTAGASEVVSGSISDGIGSDIVAAYRLTHVRYRSTAPTARRRAPLASARCSSSPSRTCPRVVAWRSSTVSRRRSPRSRACSCWTARATPVTTARCSPWPASTRPSARRSSGLVAAAIHDIDMDAHEGEHPRIGAVDVIPFIPLADTSMDDCVDLARAFGARIAEPLRSAGLPVRPRRDPGRSREAGRCPARPVRGPQGRDRPARPRARLRSGPDPSVGRGGGRRRSPVPHRLQHQPRLGRRRAGQAHRPARPRVRWRAAQGPGQRLRGPRAGARPPDPGPGLHEPAGLRGHAALAGLGERRGPGRRGRRGARRVGAHRPHAAGRVPGRGRPRRRRPGRPGRGPPGGGGRVPAPARPHAVAGPGAAPGRGARPTGPRAA